MAIILQSSGNFVAGLGFGESVNRTSKEIKLPDIVLTKLQSIGILTLEDLLRISNDNPVRVAAALNWPTSYVRDAMIMLVPKIKEMVGEDLWKIPPPVKQT